jgi:hypothetical protein
MWPGAIIMTFGLMLSFFLRSRAVIISQNGSDVNIFWRSKGSGNEFSDKINKICAPYRDGAVIESNEGK